MNGHFEPVLSVANDCLFGGSKMGELMRCFDWSKTPIGDVANWSPAFRMMVRILLANRFPMVLWWGPHYYQLYNDSFRPILGKKHPRSMGQPASECFAEIWATIGPLIDTAFTGGSATWMDDLELEYLRSDRLEEAHFTVACSPVPDHAMPSGIGGVLGTVQEITAQVLEERRGLALRELGSRSGEAKTAEEACRIAAETLSRYSKDVPFVLIYLLDRDREQAHLVGAAGMESGKAESQLLIDLREKRPPEAIWPLAETVRTETLQMVEDLQSKLPSVPRGPWLDPPRSAVVWPIRSDMAHQLAGLLVVGISSRLHFDSRYRDFCELVTGQLASAIGYARAYEAERKRAEALAEIDLAKTAFFSNVSHEFRTPLTLMLGPLEDELRENGKGHQGIEIAHRNCQRLLKLVNTLLDFSRIEAGRIEAVYEPTDLTAATTELASVFRSAVEKAGLRLVVNCPPLPEEVYVDREMWEKIVLNLLSNAFKFTFEGEIQIALCWRDKHIELAVSDTGVGIPPLEFSHIFERFHRIRGTRSRTHEGTGIGLSLVLELVKMHGGTVQVNSVEGQGSTFTVLIPTGHAHLPKERLSGTRSLVSTRLNATPFVEEALRWSPSDTSSSGPHRGGLVKRKRVRPVFSPDHVGGIYPLRNLLSASHRMSESALRVVQYITENPQRVASMSIGELAAAARSNKSAVVRVSKLSGYKGYRALRYALIENKGLMRAADLIAFDLPSREHQSDQALTLARGVVKENIELLQDTLILLDEKTLLDAVKAILSAKHVFLVGFSTAAPLAQDAYQRFLRLQVSSSVCSDVQILANIVVNTGPDDLIFCISHDKVCREMIEALQIAKGRQTPIIILTNVPGSAAARLSDIILISAVRRSPQALESVAENVGRLVVIGVISAIVAFRKEAELRMENETGGSRC